MKTLTTCLIAVILLTCLLIYLNRLPDPTVPKLWVPAHSAGLADPRKKKLHAPPVKTLKSAPAPVEILGPLRARRIVKRVLPVYPEWAEEQGLSGVFAADIQVHPDGSLASTITTAQTSCWPALDEAALSALKQWQFASRDVDGDQSGTIVFRFTLERNPSAVPPPCPAL
jgi:TonB family protein